jgi:general secretion pathway protein J
VSAAARRQRGVALLELVVAVAIFALIAVAAYAALDAVTRSRKATADAGERLAELQLAVALFERDLHEALPRSIRGGSGERQPALAGSATTLELSHSGPASLRVRTQSDVSRSAWLVSDRRLLRLRWDVLDRAASSQPRPRQMLTGVESLQLRYRDSQGAWRENWPPRDGPDADPDRLPRAIEFVLLGTNFDRVARRVALVTPAEPAGTP